MPCAKLLTLCNVHVSGKQSQVLTIQSSQIYITKTSHNVNRWKFMAAALSHLEYDEDKLLHRKHSGHSVNQDATWSQMQSQASATFAKYASGCLDLHALTSSTQKLKLIGRSNSLIYLDTPNPRGGSLRPQTWSRRRAIFILFYCASQDSNSRPLVLIPYWVACTNKFKPEV